MAKNEVKDVLDVEDLCTYGGVCVVYLFCDDL